MKRVLFAVIAVLFLLPAPGAGSVGSGDLLGLRGARHKGFHRFVIALSGETIYRVRKKGRMVEIILPDVDARGQRPGRVKSAFFTVKSIRTRKGKSGEITTITLAMRAGARIKERVLRRPYRIVVDMYPEGPWTAALRAKKGRVRKGRGRGGHSSKKNKERAAGTAKAAKREKPGRKGIKKKRANERAVASASSAERQGVRPGQKDRTGRRKEAGGVKKIAAVKRAGDVREHKKVRVPKDIKDAGNIKEARDLKDARDVARDVKEAANVKEAGNVKKTRNRKKASARGSTHGGKAVTAQAAGHASAKAKKREKKGAEKKGAGAGEDAAAGTVMKADALDAGSRVRMARMKRARILMNSGWRHEYRKKALHRLKGALRAGGYGFGLGPGFGLLGLFMPTEGAGPSARSMEADVYLERLEEEGDAAGAATLGAMLKVLRGEAGADLLEGVILRREENALTPMARFVLASKLEAEGLYTEAGAYYGMVYGSETKKPLRAAAALGKGRTLLLADRMTESTLWFSRAAKLGEREAGAWLAGVYVLRGKYEKAAHLYAGLENVRNPVALMGLGDLDMRKGDYSGAAAAFKALSERFREDDFLRSFFSMRLGDAMLGLGSEKEAVEAYKSIRKDSKGEGRLMAAMALADYYAGRGRKPLLALVLYKEVAGSRSPIAGDARIRLAALLERRGRHRAAMDAINVFFVGNIPPKSSELIRFWRSKIAFNWIKDLHEKKDWLGVLDVNYRYGDLVTLVKRAEASLMVGEAMLRTGLTPDAVLALKRAVNLGTRDVKKDALFLLVSHYLAQRDHAAAGRLLDDLRTISPGTARSPLWKEYYMRARFLAGAYEEVIRLGRSRGGGKTLVMVGRAYNSLGRWTEAGRAFRRAAAYYRKKKDDKGLMASLTGYGDSLFGRGDYAGAAAAYGSAAAMAAAGTEPEASWARYRQSLSYARAGLNGKALEVIKDLRKRDRDFAVWAEILSQDGAGG